MKPHAYPNSYRAPLFGASRFASLVVAIALFGFAAPAIAFALLGVL
jgi:hypothetical protein